MAAGALVGVAVGSGGVAVGYLRAAVAPPGAPPQALLAPGAGATVLRYLSACLAGGAALGVLWPLRRRSRAASALVGAAAGAAFAVLALPAMDAARPNWPLGPAPPRGPHRWVAELAAGAVAGALLGWGFPLRARDAAAAPGAPVV
jgi:hypothetical protein